MAFLVLAALLWQLPAAVEVAPGTTQTIALPAVPSGGATLVVRARFPSWRPAGSAVALRIVLNGRDVTPMRDRRQSRVPDGPDGDPRYEFGLWRVPWTPLTTSRDDVTLDVSDLVRRDGPNTLALANAGTSAKLVVEAARLDAAPAPPARATLPEPPDWITPRLQLPDPPRFTADGDPARVRVVSAGGTFDVVTTVVGGPLERRRAIVATPTHVEVRDSFENPTGETLGLRVRQAIATDAAWIHLGGRPYPSTADAYDPWNPTIFTPLGTGGVGLVAEDDVFRQQVHVDFDRATNSAGIRTDMLCLPPHERATLVWSIYPTATPSYWDFVNRVRADWGVNRTIPGSFCWFRPDDVLAMPTDRLAAALARQATGVCSLWGGWVDPKRTERPPTIGFGTFVLGDAFTGYRARLSAAIAKLHAARPGLRVLAYFDAQRESAPDAVTRFADSLLLGPGGKPETTDWGGQYSRTWSVVPTASNRYGTALREVPPAMRALGADGLYWDEMDAVDYGGMRITTATWDRRSCVLGPRGEMGARVGLVNLLSDEAKAGYADATFVLGNSPPTTRRFQSNGPFRMVEAQHNEAWGAFAHLSDPLGYTGARTDWAMVLDKVQEGLLPATTRLDYGWDALRRLFPFTPEYLQPGTLRGRERIVTTTSGTHAWATAAPDVRLWRYDAEGREHPARWPVKIRGGATYVRVELAPHELAILERAPAP